MAEHREESRRRGGEKREEKRKDYVVKSMANMNRLERWPSGEAN